MHSLWRADDVPCAGGWQKEIAVCQPCRIATKSCSILHHAPEPDGEEIFRLESEYWEAQRRTNRAYASMRRRFLRPGRPWPEEGEKNYPEYEKAWLEYRRLEIDEARAEERLKTARLWALAWRDMQVDSQRISDDPDFIRHLLEME